MIYNKNLNYVEKAPLAGPPGSFVKSTLKIKYKAAGLQSHSINRIQTAVPQASCVEEMQDAQAACMQWRWMAHDCDDIKSHAHSTQSLY